MEKKEAFKKIASEREQSELAQGLPGVSGLSKWGLPAAGVIVVLLGLWAYLAFFHATFGIGNTVYLYIDADDTPDSVRVKIKNTARPGISAGFPLLSALSGYTVKSGCYAVEPEDNMFSVFRRLKQGRQTPVRLTIPNVRTMDRLAGTLGKKLMMDSAVVAQHFADSAFCRQYGYDTATMACLFIPNTYEVYWNTSLEDFMKRMQKENTIFWNKERLRLAEAAGLTPNEVVTLASIVDEETANNAEKPMVAGMYINRLRTGMPLQADPTVKFALHDFSLRRISPQSSERGKPLQYLPEHRPASRPHSYSFHRRYRRRVEPCQARLPVYVRQRRLFRYAQLCTHLPRTSGQRRQILESPQPKGINKRKRPI